MSAAFKARTDVSEASFHQGRGASAHPGVLGLVTTKSIRRETVQLIAR